MNKYLYIKYFYNRNKIFCIIFYSYFFKFSYKMDRMAPVFHVDLVVKMHVFDVDLMIKMHVFDVELVVIMHVFDVELVVIMHVFDLELVDIMNVFDVDYELQKLYAHLKCN